MNSLFQDRSHHKPSKINSLAFRNFCMPFFICVVRLSQEREVSWTSWVSHQCSHREEPNFDQKRSGLSYLIPWWELKVCSFLKRRRWHTKKNWSCCMIFLGLLIAVSQVLILQCSIFVLVLQFVQDKPRVLGNLSASFSVSNPSPAYPVLLGFSYICTLSYNRGRRCSAL